MKVAVTSKLAILTLAGVLAMGGVAYACQPEVEPCQYNDNLQATSQECYEPCEYNPQIPVDSDECVPPVVDLCENIDGVQETLPEGYEVNENKQCVPDILVVEPEPVPTPTPAPVAQPEPAVEPETKFMGKTP